jgi:hypothetical protein
MTSSAQRIKGLLAAIALLASIAPSPQARAEEHDLCAQVAACRIASQAELDELRGGFHVDTPHGRLQVGIGITREVSVNDRVVAVSRLVIPDLARRDASLEGGGLVVQNGLGNHAPQVSAALTTSTSLPIIVQNTLDNQKLGTVTIIDASVNSLSLLRSIRMDEMMSRATAASGR